MKLTVVCYQIPSFPPIKNKQAKKKKNSKGVCKSCRLSPGEGRVSEHSLAEPCNPEGQCPTGTLHLICQVVQLCLGSVGAALTSQVKSLLVTVLRELISNNQADKQSTRPPPALRLAS